MADICASCGNELSAEAMACPACGIAKDSTAPDLQIGELVENTWRIEKVIGRGGMGTVFLAADERLGRQVALKTLSSKLPDPEFAERFLREGRVLAAIDHPNVVAIHAVGRHRNIPFIVMRYVEGQPLSALVRSRGGRLGGDEVLNVVRQLSVALAQVHARGVVHRDLKPANVMVGADGHVTLFDFGIARPTGSSLTRTGIVFGTPGYMAPEVIVGDRNIDGRADQYSLAVIVFELLTGFPPFIDANEEQLLMKHLTAERPPVSVAGGIPLAVDAVVARGMAIDPAHRYPDILEFSTALEAAFGVAIDERVTLQRVPLERPLGPDGTPVAPGADEAATGPDIPIATGPQPGMPGDLGAASGAVPRSGTIPAAGPGSYGVASAASPPGAIPTAGPGAAPHTVPARSVSRPGTLPTASGAGQQMPASTASLPGAPDNAGAAPHAVPTRSVSRPGTLPAASGAGQQVSARTASPPGAPDDSGAAPHALPQRSVFQPGTHPTAGAAGQPVRTPSPLEAIPGSHGDAGAAPHTVPIRSVSRPGTIPAVGGAGQQMSARAASTPGAPDDSGAARHAETPRSVAQPGTLPAAGAAGQPARTESPLAAIPSSHSHTGSTAHTVPARSVSRPGTLPAVGGAGQPARTESPRGPHDDSSAVPHAVPARSVSRPGTLPAAGSAGERMSARTASSLDARDGSSAAPHTVPARTVSRPGTIPAAQQPGRVRTVSRPGTIPAGHDGDEDASLEVTPADGDPTPPPRRSLSRPGTLPADGDPTPPPRRSLSQPGTLPADGDPTPPPRRSLSQPGTLPADGDPTPPPRLSLSQPGTDPATPQASDAESAALVLERWIRRHRKALGAAIAALVLIGVGLSFLLERPTTPPPAQPLPMNLVGMDAVTPPPPATVAEAPAATPDVLQRIEAVEERSEQARIDREKRSAAARPRIRKQIVESGSDSPEGEIQVKVTLDGNKVGAIVTLDGQPLGAAPVFAPARPGGHVVRVQYRPFPESLIPVDVKAQSSVMLEVELRPLEDLADGPPPPRTRAGRR